MRSAHNADEHWRVSRKLAQGKNVLLFRTRVKLHWRLYNKTVRHFVS